MAAAGAYAAQESDRYGRQLLPESVGTAEGLSLGWTTGNRQQPKRACDQAVRGRKSWLFANTPRGAKASATIYSLVETAQ